MDGLGLHTTSIMAGADPEQWADWDVMPAVSVTSIYKQVGPGEFKRFDYSRFGNPTRAALEKALAVLDNGKYGLVYTSGSAAISNAVHLLNAGDHIVSCDDLYPGTMAYFTQVINRLNITTTFVDGTVAENITAAMKPNTRMIWLESASNPKLKVVDIKKISELAKKKDPSVIVVVDNTFLTPCILRPLDLGADISLMSCSKYVNGHHDIIMGSLTTNSDELHEQLSMLQKILGAVPGGLDCYQVMRSLKTLPLRMDRHHENGLAVARFLSTQPSVLQLNHPLLTSHPQHQLAHAQHKGRHSGMVSFLLAGTPDNARKFVMSVKVVLLAVSLGGTMTTIAVPGSMTADDLDEQFIKARQLGPNFFRLSVGLENPEDIIEDLRQALKKAFE